MLASLLHVSSFASGDSIQRVKYQVTSLSRKQAQFLFCILSHPISSCSIPTLLRNKSSSKLSKLKKNQIHAEIVEAVYEPVPEGVYSEKVTDTISSCLTPDAEARPDIVEVSSMISDVMMKYLDNLSTSQLALEKKLERERRRTQRYFMEANRNAVTCHHELALLSQETFEKASLSSSSSGAASLKSELSESAELPGEGFHATAVQCGKEEDRPCEEALSEDAFHLEGVEKGKSMGVRGEGGNGLGSFRFQAHPLPSAGIAVSQRKVRQISDPIQQILLQLHKVIYITQLPPALHHDLKRRVIERFKKSLFSQQSNPCNLKSEIKKLSQGSPEPIEPNFFTSDYYLLRHSLAANNWSQSDPTGPPSSLELEEGFTYEQMQTVIEEVLEESGYYNFTTNSTIVSKYPHPEHTPDALGSPPHRLLLVEEQFFPQPGKLLCDGFLNLRDLTPIRGGPPRITQPKDKSTALERMEFPSQVQVLGFSCDCKMPGAGCC
ncbi:Serine/threonine-protein kinase Nek10 [Microtus ochrogaster]|uniref:Serine/threonine-protein kinase Nek10 n=1 Tax=Microtus ochrogaster TaxID=79684 RepID=A0A8J6KUH8_MICOH|nr:Serine/threonine-protein kinase Nek10 [Microtus ochrogaster]